MEEHQQASLMENTTAIVDMDSMVSPTQYSMEQIPVQPSLINQATTKSSQPNRSTCSSMDFWCWCLYCDGCDCDGCDCSGCC